MNKYITIHGHFYQPPRENPYLEKIETQESAYPYHDWNERINDECYRPNTCSRVLSPEGKILDVINNYEYLSFNIGPTLMNWLKDNDLKTYHKIIEADKLSMKRNNGHGNAIAQVYNHLIMPLANYEDKITQIIWGIEDFRKHFNRMPEGMWLAETAINMETVQALIECGIKYTILSPFQAEKVRMFFSNTWVDATSGTIDTTQPYRIFLDTDRKQFLDVFFYDAPISTAVSFEHLLRDAVGFANRLNSAVFHKEGRPALVNIATDGESYGHHEPFGDMCLAYFFRNLATIYHFQIINYAYFLELHPPVYEVIIKSGTNHEGTAWSCSHGVGRWKEDCGCSTYAGEGWNQKWRAPLRVGLDALKDRLWEIYAEKTKDIITCPILARNDYYKLFNGIIAPEEFLSKHATRLLSDEEKVMVFRLLESQRFSQLMFTSCGWFFADITGIETVQIIKYANIAILYANKYCADNLEDLLLSYLKEAKSNVGKDTSGETIYMHWIKPYELEETKAINQYMIEGVIFREFRVKQIYLFDIVIDKSFKLQIADNDFLLSRVSIRHLITGEKKLATVMCFGQGNSYQTWLSFNQTLDLENISREIGTKDSVHKVEEQLSPFLNIHKNMHDLNFETSSEVMKYLWEKKYDILLNSLNKLFLGFKSLIQSTASMGGFLPKEIKTLVEIILSANYYEEVQATDFSNSTSIAKINDIADIATKLNLTLNKERSKKYLEDYLFDLIESVKQELNTQDMNEAINFLKTLDSLDIKINKTSAENIIFNLYHKSLVDSTMEKAKKDLLTLALMLNIDISK